MSLSFRTTRRVEFRDTDAAGIMHFASFFALMENAEHEFLRSLGTSVIVEREGRVISWPRVSAKCDYSAPARFEDELEIVLTIVRLGERSVTYNFQFGRGEDEIAAGRITTVCCQIEHGIPPQSIAIPEDLAARLAEYRAEQ